MNLDCGIRNKEKNVVCDISKNLHSCLYYKITTWLYCRIEFLMKQHFWYTFFCWELNFTFFLLSRSNSSNSIIIMDGVKKKEKIWTDFHDNEIGTYSILESSSNTTKNIRGRTFNRICCPPSTGRTLANLLPFGIVASNDQKGQKSNCYRRRPGVGFRQKYDQLRIRASLKKGLRSVGKPITLFCKYLFAFAFRFVLCTYEIGNHISICSKIFDILSTSVKAMISAFTSLYRRPYAS